MGWPIDEGSLRRAYRKAAMRSHPDRGGTNSEFVEVQRSKEHLQNWLGRRQPDNSWLDELLRRHARN